MKTLISIVIGLLVVGCLTPEQKLRDSVIGEYEFTDEDGETYKGVFLDNGIVEEHENGNKLEERKWTIVNGEIQVDDGSKKTPVLRINKDRSITRIGYIFEGKRTVYSKKDQWTFKKIK